MRRGSVIDAPRNLGAYRYERPHPAKSGFMVMSALAEDGHFLFTANKEAAELNNWWLAGATLYPSTKAYAEAKARG